MPAEWITAAATLHVFSKANYIQTLPIYPIHFIHY